MNKYIIIFLLFTLSVFFVDNLRIENLQNEQFYSIYLENIIDNALIDSANKIRLSGEQHGDTFEHGIHPYDIISGFFDGIKFSLGYNNDDIQEFKIYVPFVLILDGDGFYIYKLDEIHSSNVEISHRLYPKEYFSYADEDALYGFDTNLNITIYDKSNREMIATVNALDNEERNRYESDFAFLKESKLILNMEKLMYAQINNAINTAINSHKFLAGKKGVFYDFHWDHHVEDLNLFKHKKGIALMVQGLPISGNRSYEYMRFNKFEVSDTDMIYGFIKNGIRYCSKKYPETLGYETIETFMNYEEATKSGYYIYDSK